MLNKMKKVENLKSYFEKLSSNLPTLPENKINFSVLAFLKKHYGKIIAGLLIGFLLGSFWSIKSLFNPRFLTQKHLVIFFNQAESRPCGGFATGFGEVQVFPPSFFFKNIYQFEKENLGPQKYPLSLVSTHKKFWDLGDTENLSYCGKNFLFYYNQINKKDLHSVILVNFNFLEKWIDLLGSVTLEGKEINSRNLFATLSRKVSNVDRHDEKALEGRKSALSVLAKTLVMKTAFRPYLWGVVSDLMGEEIEKGRIYIEGKSPEIASNKDDFVLLEWNLGGGKSSRYLSKNLTVKLREIAPNNWEIKSHLKVSHLGSFDEPLSQIWKGVFEIRMPEFLGGEIKQFETLIAPGNFWEESWSIKSAGDITNLSFFKPPSQDWNLNLQISEFGQKQIVSHDEKLKIRENTASFLGFLNKAKTKFSWDVLPDKIKPFITFHEIINPKILEDSPHKNVQDFLEKRNSEFLFVEIHFNEEIQQKDNFAMVLQDRNFTHEETLNPEFEGAILLPNQTTLLAKFKVSGFQSGERYFVKVSGIEDSFANTLQNGNRTVITR